MVFFVRYDVDMNTTDQYLASLPQWQNINLALFRSLIHEVVPSVTEDLKWNVPVFIINGKAVFAMAAFKSHTKYNFIANGALIDDSKELFNNGFDSKKSRGIDLHENQILNKEDLKSLIRIAVNSLSS
jgi:hypothetical protein